MKNDKIWDAIDRGGGQTCDIEGVVRELRAAGFEIVPIGEDGPQSKCTGKCFPDGAWDHETGFCTLCGEDGNG